MDYSNPLSCAEQSEYHGRSTLPRLINDCTAQTFGQPGVLFANIPIEASFISVYDHSLFVQLRENSALKMPCQSLRLLFLALDGFGQPFIHGGAAPDPDPARDGAAAGPSSRSNDVYA